MTRADDASKVPALTIGLPVYNGEQYLEGCLRNLLGQRFTDFEVVISDNGSSDGTQDICRRLAAEDARVHYYRAEENGGASWNYNRVVELARGRYFKWAAYDDLVSGDYSEACVKALDADPGIVLAYGCTVIIDAEGKEQEKFLDRISMVDERPSKRFREYLYKVGLTNAIYGVMRVEALRGSAGHLPYPGSDIVLLSELALRGRFREIPEVHFYRRIHAKASAPANPSLGALAGWFDPKHNGRLVLPEWEHLRGYVAAVRRTPMRLGEKLRCLGILARWKRHALPLLLKEALMAARAGSARRP